MGKTIPDRFVSLDVFRGITIAAMILVNNPGSWQSVYSPLLHAEWHGWTPTDLIFPFFLFIVGVAITLSLERRIAAGASRTGLLLPILRRSLIIFGLGLVLSGFPFYRFSTLRIPGVLQRIGICYFFGSLLYLYCGLRGRVIALISLLLGYWAMMVWIPVPGIGSGQLTPEGNLSAYLDRYFLEGHLYASTRVYDPEGILSTLPAIATVVFGILTGQWFRSSENHGKLLSGLVAGGVILCGAGLVWDLFFPINKKIWTSSYAVFCAGMALLFLSICYWSADVRHHRLWIRPFLVFGMNAITVYVLSGLLSRVLLLLTWTDSTGTAWNLKTYLYQTLFAAWASPKNASFLWAFTYVFFWWGVMYVFYRKKIFIRI